MRGGVAVAQRKVSEEGAGEQLDRADADPAWPRRDQRQPPLVVCRSLRRREKPEEVNLLADLHNEGEHDGGRGAEHTQVKSVEIAVQSGKSRPGCRRLGHP